MKNAICFRCACVFPLEKNDFIECPSCHSLVKTEAYEKLLNYAISAVTYGYHYRMRYERDFQQDNTLSTKYKISVEEIWTFCALAVLSGIIGNVAYDLLKAVIKKILDQFKSKGDLTQVDEITEIADDPDKFELLLTYLRDYYDGMIMLNPKIREAIMEEINGDVFSDTMPTVLLDTLSVNLKKSEINEQEIMEMLKSQVQNKKNTTKFHPENSDFDMFWKLFE